MFQSTRRDQERALDGGWDAGLFRAVCFLGREELAGVLRGFLMSRSMASADSAKLCNHCSPIFLWVFQRRGWTVLARWVSNTSVCPGAGEILCPVHRHLPVDPGTIFKYWIFRYYKPGDRPLRWPPAQQ